MFYTEEDVAPAVQIAVELFGPVGNMLPDSRLVNKNVTVGSDAFGKLWYGDIEGSEEYVSELCGIFSKRINQTVKIVPDSF